MSRPARVAALRALGVVLAGITLSGCYDTRQDIYLNPDGTGRAVLQSSFAQEDPLKNEAVSSPERIVRDLLEDTEGVDAWRDISCEEREDGRFHLRATAYFTDLKKFKTKVNQISRFSISRDGAGGMRIESSLDRKESPVTLPTTNETITAESIRRERRQFRANQPLLAAMLGSIKVETIFHLPGTFESVSNFERISTNSFRLRFDGARGLAAVERFLFDPEIARRRLEGSYGDIVDSEAGNQFLYGQKGPVRIVMKGASRPLFDYAAEVASARQAFPAVARTFHLPESIEKAGGASPAAVDGAPARVAVTGVEWRYDAGSDGNMFRLGVLQSIGYSLRLRAELPGAVFDVRGVHLKRVTTAEGISLPPPEVKDYKLDSRNDTGERTNVFFSLGFGLPARDSRGWAELSGNIECSSAQNFQEIELASGLLLPGTKGNAFSTELESVSNNKPGGYRLVLTTELELESQRMVWVKVLSDGNQVLELTRQGTMIVGKRRSYTFTSSKAIPRSGRLVAGVLAGDQRVVIPFALTNITLLGHPLVSR